MELEGVRFESTLASRLAGRGKRRNWIGPRGGALAAAATLAIVVCMASASIGASQAVILVGSKTSVAEFVGTLDGVKEVVEIQVTSTDDLVVIKTPLKGRLSDVLSISYMLFISQTGGDGQLEPFATIKLTAARSLVCNPVDSYASAGWSLPLLEWQSRELVSGGLWTLKPAVGLPLLMPLADWIDILQDPQVVSLSIAAGHWQTPSSFECMLGDLSVNGSLIGIANAKRSTSTVTELLAAL